MSADDQKNITLTGRVAKKKMGGASKSAHTGFVLKQTTGAISLRRDGGNPFYDDYFENFEGKEVTVNGYDMEQYFLVSTIQVAK